jgi:hypothetical protein
MWHAMFVEQIPVAEKILRTVLVYALIAVLFRLTGKRALGVMNTFDFVVIFLLSKDADCGKARAAQAAPMRKLSACRPVRGITAE